MKITRMRVFQAGLPYVDGAYRWGAGNAIEVARASVVVIDTDAGISGCGEFTPCGENYIEAHSAGVPALTSMVAPRLLGEDPRRVAEVEALLDHTVRGHGYAKAPIDAACWDILGKSLDEPLWALWGGKLSPKVPMYRVAPQRSAAETEAELERHRAAGYRQFQIKVGADWANDIERIRMSVPLMKPGETALADANQGWRVDHAIRVARAVEDLDFILEQPCRTYDECLQVRSQTSLPMKLDECVTGMDMVHRIVTDRSAELVCLKISNLGGLSKARRVRDAFVAHRIPVVAEDTWGGEIASAALAQFAATTPTEYLQNTTDLMNYNTKATGLGGPTVEDGCLLVSDSPGLGVTPDYDSLGDPVFDTKAAP